MVSVSAKKVKKKCHACVPLNMELDLQSLFGLHVQGCTNWLRPRNPPLPPLLGIYEGPIG
jgi:hypothetical protein